MSIDYTLAIGHNPMQQIIHQHDTYDSPAAQGIHSPTKKQLNWKKELKKIKEGGGGHQQQFDQYLEHSRKIEEKAQRKQEQLEANREKAGIDDILEINEMYIESVRGKLELLNDLDII